MTKPPSSKGYQFKYQQIKKTTYGVISSEILSKKILTPAHFCGRKVTASLSSIQLPIKEIFYNFIKINPPDNWIIFENILLSVH